MKKLTKAQLEAKLRAMQLEDMKDDMLPLDEMKQRALHEYEALQQGEKHRQRSSISHKLAAIAVVVICLIGGSFLFSVFAPTLVSSANDFMKRAGIWVNDVLRLGIVVEKPLESIGHELDSGNAQTEFASVEEAINYFGVPLLKLEDDAEVYTLSPLIAELDVKPFYTLSYQYTDNAGDFVSFEYEYIADEVNVNIDDNTSEWISPIGTMLLWTSDNDIKALCSYGAYILHVNSSLSEVNFKAFIENCVLLNSP